MSSLRARLVAGQLLGVSVFLALSGVAIYWIVRGRMLAEIDRSLVELARSNLPPLVREIGLRPPLDPSRAFPERRPLAEQERWARELDAREQREERPEGALPGLGEREDLLFQSWRLDGRPGPRSRRLGERVLPRIAERLEPHAFEDLDEQRLAFASFELEPELDAEGRTWRAVGGIFRPPAFAPAQAGQPRPPHNPPPIEAVFAKDVSALVETLRRLRWLLVLGWLGSSLGCAAILSFVVHRTLRPLQRLDRQLAQLDARKLGQRFEVEGLPDELAPVVEQLDALLARLHAAFEREQALSAYAAHELRTPLAGLRSTLEVSLARERSSAERREAEEQCLAITKDLEQLVERLLELARASSAELGEPAEPQPLAALVEAALAPHVARAEQRSLAIARHIPHDLIVPTDARLLARVLDNLIDNAVSYADPGSEVRLRVEPEPDAWTLAVSNEAATAPPELAQRAFDPFWRADAARSATGQHAGLGLALCKRIVERLGGRIEAELAGGRFTIRLRLPASAPG